MTKRYVLQVLGCVEPRLVGPYKTVRGRDTAARRLRNADQDDGVFWLNVTDGKAHVGAYSGGFMDDKPGFEGSEG